jgi:hypothetical protein
MSCAMASSRPRCICREEVGPCLFRWVQFHMTSSCRCSMPGGNTLYSAAKCDGRSRNVRSGKFELIGGAWATAASIQAPRKRFISDGMWQASVIIFHGGSGERTFRELACRCSIRFAGEGVRDLIKLAVHLCARIICFRSGR